jgi:hypothetical protein
MPVTVFVVELWALFAMLAEPQWLTLANVNDIQPRVPWHFVRKRKDNIDFFERTESRLGVEEEDEWNDDEICCSEDDPRAVADVGECDWGDEDNAVDC